MFICIDRDSNLLVDIGDREPTPELVEQLREKYKAGKAKLHLRAGMTDESLNSLRERSKNKSHHDDDEDGFYEEDTNEEIFTDED